MMETEIHTEFCLAHIVGESDALRRVLNDIETVARVDATVLIYGETGTGRNWWRERYTISAHAERTPS